MLLVLGAVNLVFLVSGFIGLVGRNVDPIWLAFLAVILFGANAVPCLMLGLAGFRGVRVGSAGSAGEVDEESAAEQEGDSGIDEDGE
jgi:hypothetical protein